jgi:hypothetical protein
MRPRAEHACRLGQREQHLLGHDLPPWFVPVDSRGEELAVIVGDRQLREAIIAQRARRARQAGSDQAAGRA